MTNDDGSRLFDACFAEDVALVRELVTSIGADAIAWQKPGSLWTPLHMAAEHHNLALVEVLLAVGAPLESKDWNGWTPLHLAVDSEIDAATQRNCDLDLSVTAFLVHAGSNPHAVANDGTTPIDIARSCPEAEALLAKGR